MKRKARIGTRILLLVTFTIFVAIGLILGVTTSLVSKYNKKTITQEVINGVAVLTEWVEDLKESSASYAKLSAKDERIAEHIQNGDAGWLENTAKSILDSTKTGFIIITDNDGQIVGSAGQKSSASNLKNAQIIGNALKGNTITTIESGITAHFSALTVAPVKAADGSVVGTIIVGYVLENESFLDEIKEMIHSNVTIFKGDIRVNTTVMKDGVRQVGTQLSQAVANTVINEGKDYDGEADILGSQYLTSYRPLKNHNGEIIGVLFAGRSLESATQLVNRITSYAILTAVLSEIAIIVILVLHMRTVLSVPLKKIMRAADEISQGVLDIELNIKSSYEMGMLSDTFTKMADKLHGLIAQVSESSDSVAITSKEIADSSFTLSKESVEQAATVQELSASSMEILSMTQSNAEHAKNAATLSETVKDRCTEGNEKMHELLEAMNGISKSSKKISNVIKVIDDIAFQTNILSLNAAVEAAQAGQYGKGFAVVAENVKQLAQKSAKAAKEVAAMIEESVTNSNSGTAMANETATILADIFEKINEVHAMITEISTSSAEQSTGISQISSAIERISGILQSYSSMAEESSAASAKLSEEAEIMKQQVATFKLKKQ